MVKCKKCWDSGSYLAFKENENYYERRCSCIAGSRYPNARRLFDRLKGIYSKYKGIICEKST